MAGRRNLARVLVAIALVIGIALGPLMGLGRSAELGSAGGSASGFAFRTVLDLTMLPDAVKADIASNYQALRSALPAEAQALLPQSFPFLIDQRFIETLAILGDDMAAEALLGSGLDGAARVTESGTKTANTAKHLLPSDDLPILAVSAGDLVATIGDGPSVSAEGTLASVTGTLENLASTGVLPLSLQDAFATVTATVNDTVNTVEGTVDGLLGDVADEYAGAVTSDPLLGGVLEDTGLEPIVTDPTALADAITLPNIDNAMSNQLVSIGALDNDSSSRKTDSGVILSQARSVVAEINVLDFLFVDAIDLQSVSQAGGVPGSANNSSSCDILDVRLGSQDGVGIEGDTLYVGGEQVPVPSGEVAGLKAQVDEVLDVAGIDITLCGVADAAAADDGTSASQTVSAFHVEIAPKLPVDIAPLGLSQGDTLFRFVLDPTVETAAAAQVATDSEDPSLPRTGAATIATVVMGLGLAGGAYALRRRLI